MKTTLFDVSLNIVQILGFIETARFDTHKVQTFQGIEFLFFYTYSLEMEEGPTPAFYASSTENEGGYDIYVFRFLSREEKRRALFHEVFEIFLRERGVAENEAHLLALAQEVLLYGRRPTQQSQSSRSVAA